MENFDLIIVGLGPAGLRAAQSALKKGLKVLAFEKKAIGGCCLNFGCIPTKTIMHSSNVFKNFETASKLGLNVTGAGFDFNKIIERKNSIVEKLQKASENALLKAGLKIIKEEAVVDFENLTVNSNFKAENIILATGSMPFEIADLPFDGVDILSSDDVLNLTSLPKSVAIIGSGAIGVEWARIFSNFNIETSVVELAENLLPLMDLDIQKRIARIFKMKKIKFYTGAHAEQFKNGRLKLNTGVEIQAEKILVATGRKRIYPENLKINADLTTNFKNVYAAGDIAANKMLAHVASMQADYLIEKITGREPKLTSDELIPSVIYGEPEIASIGVREQDLGVNYLENGCKIYNLPLSFLAKSWCDDKADGFIKIITKNNIIKGAHIVSPEASSLIAAITIAMKQNCTVSELQRIVFPHPAYSEGIYEAIVNG